MQQEITYIVATLTDEVKTMNECNQDKYIEELKEKKLELQEKLILNPHWPAQLQKAYEERITELEDKIEELETQRKCKKRKTRADWS